MDFGGRLAGAAWVAVAQIYLAPRHPGSLVTTMSEAGKAVVLLSGGMDSCVCATIACKQHGATNVALLHASYGQRTESREARAFREIADFYAVTRRLMVRFDHFRAM